MKNVKLAKELIKIAKSLVAVNPYENFSDLWWYYINKSLEEGDFLKALEDYLILRAKIVSAIQGNSQNLSKIYGAMANVLRQYSQYQGLNTQEIVEKIDEIIAQAKNKISGKGETELALQRYIEGLIETKQVFFIAKNKTGKLSIVMRNNAKGLMSRIANIIHQNNISLLDNKGVADQLRDLLDFLKNKNLELQVEDSKQTGDKNYTDDIREEINQKSKNIRVRLDQMAKTLIQFHLKKGKDVEDTDLRNQRVFIAKKITEDLKNNFGYLRGYFTTIDTATLSFLEKNRENQGLINIPHDIPQEKSQKETSYMYEIIDELKINPELLQQKLHQLKQRKSTSISIENAKKILNDIASTFNIDKTQLEEILTKFLSQNTKIKKSLNLNHLTQIFEEIKNSFKNINGLQKYLDDELKKLQSGDNIKKLKISDLEEIFDKKDFKKLKDEHKKLLLDYLNDNRQNLIQDIKISKIASNITAGFLGDLWEKTKNFFTNAFNKLKQTFKNTWEKLINKLIPQEQIEQDFNKFDEENQRIAQMLNMMKELDEQLLILCDELRNQNYDN